MAIDIVGYIQYILYMYFLLHHSTGALVLDANCLDDVLAWRQRQLGQKATSSFVTELDDQLPDGWAEKSGTGLAHISDRRCQARLSFMADSVQRVIGLNHDLLEPIEWHRVAELRSRKAAVH